MLVLGFDPGTNKTGWCLLRCEEEKATFQAGGHVDNDRVLGLIDQYPADLVVVEKMKYQGPFRSGKNVLETQWIGGMIADRGLTRRGYVRICESSAWRSLLLGKHNAGDHHVFTYVDSRVALFPTLLPKHKRIHMADAACIAIWGYQAPDPGLQRHAPPAVE